VEGGIGVFLRELRQSRGFSVGQLAARAQIGKATVSRWENGACQPDLPTLTAVLEVLQVPAAHRERALELVPAARALRERREVVREQALALGVEEARLPAAGDLLRAMRRRRGLTLEQLAAALRVAPGTLSRWEQSQSLPPLERREELFQLLGACPEEQAVLMQWRLPDAALEAHSLDALEQEYLDLHARQTSQKALIDLRLLTLEARIWRLLPRRAACRLLTQTYTLHGRWLCTWGRAPEAGWYSQRTLELGVQEFPAEAFWLEAVHLGAFIAVHGGPVFRPERGAERLRPWVEEATARGWETTIYRDLGGYLGECRQFDAAFACLQRARQAAERAGLPDASRLANANQVYILRLAGRSPEALALLPQDEHPDPHHRMIETSHRASALFEVGEKAAAHEEVARAYALAHAYGFSTHGLEALARKF
jgi:transcriptional regulator with XRE-family HTH domain